jgi:hypothetical protein
MLQPGLIRYCSSSDALFATVMRIKFASALIPDCPFNECCYSIKTLSENQEVIKETRIIM